MEEAIERMMPAKDKRQESAAPHRVSTGLNPELTAPSEPLLDDTGDNEEPEDFQRQKPAQIADSARSITPRARGELVAA